MTFWCSREQELAGMSTPSPWGLENKQIYDTNSSETPNNHSPKLEGRQASFEAAVEKRHKTSNQFSTIANPFSCHLIYPPFPGNNTQLREQPSSSVAVPH